MDGEESIQVRKKEGLQLPQITMALGSKRLSSRVRGHTEDGVHVEVE